MFVNKYLQKSQLGNVRKSDTLDLEFLLPRFECKSEDVYTVKGQDGNVPPFSAQFCKVPRQEHIFALACEEGEIIFMNSEYPAEKSCIKSWSAHNNAVFDLCWLRQSNHMITASGDQTAALWDTTTSEKLSSFKGHASSVKTVSLNPRNESVFATGSRDGNIFFWDSRIVAESHHKPMCSIPRAHESACKHSCRQRKRLRKGIAPAIANPLDSITCVLFQNEHTILSTGSSDWIIKGWDIRYLDSKKPVETAVPLFNINNSVENHKNHGYTSMVLNPNGRSFFANCMDGTISQYDCDSHTPQLMSTYYGHMVKTFFVKMDISRDGQFLISGSSDDKAYIWKVSKPGVPLVSLEGHDAEVTAVAWHSKDITKVITCGDDDQVLNWTLADLSVKENDGTNPTRGKSQMVNPKDVRLPLHRDERTPQSHNTPNANSAASSSNRKISTPATPTSNKSISSPLTQWFTPKHKVTLESRTPNCTNAFESPLNTTTPESKFPRTLTNEFTPQTNFRKASEAKTPVKAPLRTILGELGNSEQKECVESIRRSINFGAHCDQTLEKGKTSPPEAKKSKTNRNSSSNKRPSYSIKNFFRSTPRSII